MSYDIAVIGAGIVGLAHAWRAAARGKRVLLLERTAIPCGASIRNFGMVWPIGQPFDQRHEMAMRSRSLWLELAEQANIWVEKCGSLHVAHRDDEWAVLNEFADVAKSQTEVQLESRDEVLKRTSAAKEEGLRGGLWSPTELCVNPREAVRQTAEFLQSHEKVDAHFETTVISIDGNEVRASDGRAWQAEQVFVCGGTDFQTLFPKTFRDAGLRITKLQMMRTEKQPDGFHIGSHLASGLTLRHYDAFEPCPSLPKLRERVATETPELNRLGIHVMAAQHNSGHVVLGDSHEYDEDIAPFDRQEIEGLMLRELQKQFELPSWKIESRWNGSYAKHPSDPILRLQPRDNVWICVSPGGAGMTLSFGWADAFWQGA